MRTGTLRDTGNDCTIYDSLEEALKEVGEPPVQSFYPKYCNKCGNVLIYYSFCDTLNRFTLKVVCEKCHDKWAISLSPEAYERNMLKRWTERVKERDGNKCRMQDDKCKGPLHAHHIIPKHLDPSKKYEVENGITLCEAHHKMIHRYM